LTDSATKTLQETPDNADQLPCPLVRTEMGTFDDGLRCQFEQAVPILDRYRLPATFFLVANLAVSYFAIEFLTERGRSVTKAQENRKLKMPWSIVTSFGEQLGNSFEVGKGRVLLGFAQPLQRVS
jgi:Polysaccharide deacetylase